MRSIEEAREGILGRVEPLAPIELPLVEVHGCVLAADVVAEFDVPPFSTAEADGYAARAADIHGAGEAAPVSLRVVGSSEAGRPADATVGWGEAVRVTAGAPVPAGADAVVPLDRCRAEGDGVAVVAPVEAGSFVVPAGREVRAGEILVPAGRKLAAPEMGVLARAGQPAPPAYPRVRVAVMAVGEGMVEPGRPAAFGQQRETASYVIIGSLRDAGAVPYRAGLVPPAPHEIREAVYANLSRADCFILTTGGGEEIDPEALEGLGPIEQQEVAMYPGMQSGFGVVEGIPFFVLPGASISAFVIFEILVRPAILRMMGRRDVARPRVQAILDEDLSGPSGVTLFAPALVEHREGAWHARPQNGGDPDRLAGLVGSNGLIVAPPGDTELAAGEQVQVRIFRPLEH